MSDSTSTIFSRKRKASRSSRSPTGTVPGVRLAMSSDPVLRDEITEILRRRLRIVSSMMIIAFVLFMLRGYVRHETLLQAFRLAVLMTAIGCVVMTSPSLNLSRSQLRIVEVALFLAVVLISIAFQIVESRLAIEAGNQDALLARTLFSYVTWNLVIMMYGMFIPNTWRRALLFIVPAVITPTAIALVFAPNNPHIYPYLYLGFLLSVVAGFASLLGTHFVNTLQREAHEARQFGQYKLTRRLGAGGMGEVFLAEHRLLKRPSAIKLINPNVHVDSQMVSRFESEVQATATLSHWNTVDIFDYGRTNDGVFYYVMEYLPGQDLQMMVKEHGPLSPPRTVHFLMQICAALEEAHGIGLIHRDIKPANVIACVRGGVHDVAKLLDFGLVQQVNMMRDSQPATTIEGSPLFMSPEHFDAPDSLDARSDLYSLGITAYFLLSGQYPIVGSSAASFRQAHLSVVPAALSTLVKLSTELEAAVARCLNKQPGQRFQTASELQIALRNTPEFGKWSAEHARSWWADINEK